MKQIDIDREIVRANNIQWTVSDAYDWNPENPALSNEGTADVYENFLAGAIRRIYDPVILDAYRDHLERTDPQAGEFLRLTHLALEMGAMQRIETARPIAKVLRKAHAQEIVRQYAFSAPKDTVQLLELAMAERALGKVPKINAMTKKLLDDLCALSQLESDAFVKEMQSVLKKHFHFNPSQKEEMRFYENVEKRNRIVKETRLSEDMADLQEQFGIGSAEFNDNILLDESKKEAQESELSLFKETDNADALLRAIEERFGKSILTKRQIDALEEEVSVGENAAAKLLVTDGSLPETASAFRKQTLEEEREKNLAYKDEHFPQILRSITKLTERIRNSILNELEEADVPTKDGILLANRIWRGVYLNDQKVFHHPVKDDVGTLRVSLLLDASASQLHRQSIVCAQAYIIAQSLLRLSIPVDAYSFQSMHGYTVMRRYLDQHHKDPEALFSYAADASNRDGFAIGVMAQWIQPKPNDHSVLIVLTDGKPNDVRAGINAAVNPSAHEYTGNLAIRDTARAVRKLRERGVSVLGVFTGEEEDRDAARLIYGHSFAYIKQTERFADVVGLFLKEEISQREG